ncbi:MAG: integration host factor subunit alpha [Candidatus Paracaedibacteraceae bacterium]|nr:integration host factor subunit alpha [Candidatus Paracaedibacteraceae bacterium]
MSNNTITRADLVANLVDRFDLDKIVAVKMLESVLNVITTTLATGDSVKISGFGSFNIREKNERVGRNPRTGVEAKITARNVISFKASPIFKSVVMPVVNKKAA